MSFSLSVGSAGVPWTDIGIRPHGEVPFRSNVGASLVGLRYCSKILNKSVAQSFKKQATKEGCSAVPRGGFYV